MANSRMEQKLKEAALTREMAELYQDKSDMSSFMMGFVCAVAKDTVLVAYVYFNGITGGFYALHAKDIYSIMTNTQYIKRLRRLYALRKQSHEEVPQVAEDQIENLLRFARETGKIVSIALRGDGDDIRGLVTSVDARCVEIFQYDRDAKYDGDVIVYREDILHVHCDGMKESSIWLLLHAGDESPDDAAAEKAQD